MPPGPDGTRAQDPQPAARRRDPVAKRARIVEAAAALFREEGFEATSTAAIAREAGVSEGIVFHHFGSKHGLLQAVAEAYGRGLASAMFELGGPEVPSAETVLRRAFAYVRGRGALSMLLAMAASPEAQHTARSAVRGEILGVLERAFESWIAAGRIRRLEAPRLTADLLFALVEAALTACFVHGDGSREEEYLREAVACIDGALRPVAASPPPRTPS